MDTDFEILLEKLENVKDQKIDAEELLLDLYYMPWYKRAFSKKRILKYIKESSEKQY
jgi:hypothetical protein